MTREPGLDDRTIDWLCEGPERAPDWVLSGADAYARSHPRRRFGAWRSGRSLMSHLHLVRPEEDAGERRVSRAWAGFGVVALTAVLVVGAFGVGARWGRGEPPAGGIGVPSAAPGPWRRGTVQRHWPPPARWRQATPTRNRAASRGRGVVSCAATPPAPIRAWRAR